MSNRILAVTGIVASGMLFGTSVRAAYLKCVNDEGKLAFVNTGSCPEGYRPSDAYPDADSILPGSAADPDQPTPAAAASGSKVPTIWELGFGDPAAQEWLRKERTDTSTWTTEGRASTPEKVWNVMKAALLRGDTERAVRCFSPLTRDQYRETFQALGSEARVMAQQMKELLPREKSDFSAVYYLPRDTEIDGRMVPLVFSVYFSRGGDGVWLIDHF